MPIIAIANQKGGVGKTATTANLGAALAQAGQSVRLIDLDPQANLTLSCGLRVAPDQPSAYEVLMQPRTTAAAALCPTPWDGLAILPAREDLAAAGVQLASAANRNERLARKLAALPPANFTLIDTPPSLGFLTLNALTAADWVLIPVQASFLALHGLRQLMQTVEAVRAHGRPELHIGGVLLTMFDPRTLHAQQVQERLVQTFGEVVFETTIRRSVIFDYATVAGEPLLIHRPAHPAADTYRQLAREVMARA